MKKILFFISIISVASYGQNKIPFYEQLAFEFYKDSIADKSRFRKKIKIAKYTNDIHPDIVTFQVNKCLEGKTLKEGKELKIYELYNEELMKFDSPTNWIKYEESDKKLFRFKNSDQYGYPRLKISKPYHQIDDFSNFYVNIIEEINRNKTDIYYLKFDDKGSVINWCKTKTVSIIIE